MTRDSARTRASAASDRNVTLGSKALILLAVATAYASNFWPERVVLKYGMNALGNPQYNGFLGVLLPHLLLYSTVIAAVSAVLWWLLVRSALLLPPQFGHLRRSVPLGVAGGIAALVVTLAVVWAALPGGAVHWIAPDPWKIAGNLFSNFYEEFAFRGFVLVSLRRIFGFWTAALASSAMWAILHVQYPWSLQVTIFAIGVGFGWLAQRAQSLWAPYIAHEVLDLIGDSLIG
jgi:membrane protease YdiL (CAAX protease family)